MCKDKEVEKWMNRYFATKIYVKELQKTIDKRDKSISELQKSMKRLHSKIDNLNKQLHDCKRYANIVNIPETSNKRKILELQLTVNKLIKQIHDKRK